MTWTINRLITVSALAIALGMGASQAYAQKATFHLPYEAHWGRAVLHPGNYTLTAPESTSVSHIFYLQGAAGTQMAVPRIVGTGVASSHSYLKLVNVDGTYYVQEYASTSTGTSLKFAIPKATHRNLSAEARVLLTSK